MYRAPVTGRLEPKNEGEALETELTTVEECARVCFQSGVCGGFSVTITEDVSKVMFRIAMKDDVDVVDDEDSTTWFSESEFHKPCSLLPLSAFTIVPDT